MRSTLYGYRGRLGWWALWWPLGLPLRWLCLLAVLLAEGDGGFRAPRRVIWRDGSRRAHLVFRGLAGEYRAPEQSLDPRLVAAIVGLHQSHDPSEGAAPAGWYGS